MDEHSTQQPLLPEPENPQTAKTTPTRSVVISSAKWLLKSAMWTVFIAWIAVIFLYPTAFTAELFGKWIRATEGTVFGITGSLFVTFSAPILVIAMLAAVYLIISGDGEPYQIKKGNKRGRARLWTFPVLVDGPFAVVTAAELIGIAAFVVYVLWALYNYTLRMLAHPSLHYLPPKLRSAEMLEILGARIGSIGVFCLAFLFLPISRGSLLLRLIDIPFEHATRYHVWLGHLTMLIFTLHGLAYVLAWLMQGRCLHQLVEWKDIGVANLPGVISLLAGLLMWVTSLPKLRTKNFELFFYTHQLYILFILFLALHVGDFIFSIAAAAVFLFMLDRFLRFCQSRPTVDVLSAKALPCQSLELVLSKPKSLRYNALSFVFLQVRELSWLEWHPFSVSSSPLDGEDRMAVLIKGLGKWTHNLRRRIVDGGDEEEERREVVSRAKSCITASVEGPYGHESPYHLMYENLILVAGGIGISPFLAILSDVLHRTREGKPCLPKNILVIWAVKKSDELSLLSTLDVEAICPFFSHKLNIDISIFVTRQSHPPLVGELEAQNQLRATTQVCPLPKGCPMSVLVGTGDTIWSGSYVIFSTVGFLISLALLDTYYINPFHIIKWWYKGLLFLACMAAGVLFFGGSVVALWSLWERHVAAGITSSDDANDIEAGDQDGPMESLKDLSDVNGFANSTTVRYGSRPDFEEIFGSVAEKWGNVDIGVIICGPSTLQSSVAKAIRSHNLGRRSHHPVFHFHSHSFDL